MEHIICISFDTVEFETLSVKQLESIENDLNLHTELSQRNDDRIQDIEDKIKNSKSSDLSSSINRAVSGDLMDKMRALADHVNNIEAAYDKKFNGLHADIHSVAKNMEYIEQDLKESNQMIEESFQSNLIMDIHMKYDHTIGSLVCIDILDHMSWSNHRTLNAGPNNFLKTRKAK